MSFILTCKNRGRPSILRWFTAVCLAAVTLFATADAALAFPVNQCPGDRKGSDLGCTAADVSLTGMAVVGDTTSCIGGTNITLDLQMTVNFAVPDRWDIGIFISNDGKDPQIRAASGGAATCAVSVLPNSSPFLSLDGGATGDTCGDGNGTIGGGTGSGIHYMSDVTVPCQSLAGAGGKLYIPFVVSWDNQKTTPGAVCTSNADPVPNTTSKCNAPTIVQGSIEVVVLPEITKTDGITTIFSGGSTSYTVTITNKTGASLSGAVFKDPVVTGISVNSLSCAAAGGASCPAGSTVAAMQGAGITIPAMPVGGSVTFTIGATLTGIPGFTLTNTATVRVSSQTNTASDTDTIVDTIAILPTTQSKNGDKGSTVTYTYTLYNFGVSTDTISLAAVSSKGWTVGVSPTPVTVPAGGTTTVTLTVTIPVGAAIGDVDSTTITATSGNNPSKTATANAVTTVTTVLTLTPSNTGSGGAGASVYYTHRVENNASTSKSVSLTPSFTSGSCTSWTSALYESNNTTPLSSPVTLAAYGGYKDFVLKISISAGAAALSTCTATLTAQYTSGAPNTVSVTDVTTVKNLVLYEDTSYFIEQYVYPAGNNVYAKGYGLTSGRSYEYRWYDSSGAEACTPRAVSTTGTTFPDTCAIPTTGPLGTWTVQIWDLTSNPDALFVQSNFYVGPDHLKASYSGANPVVTTNVVIDLALHDKANHVVPFDPSGNLVKGNAVDPEGPLMITVTVSGSATIVSTTLTNAVITGQSVTGKLNSTTGTATLTISDSVAETVTITPVSYKGLLYGSPTRDEPATVTFVAGAVGPNHYELSLATASITCLSSTVTVTACADTSSPCTNNYTAASGKTAALATSAGTLGATTVTFSASGVATTTLSYPSAADGTAVTVMLSNEQTTATSARQCCQGGICAVADSCNTTFNTAGFIFSSAVNGAVATIPTQIAGKSAGTYYLRAIKTNTTTKVCESALAGANTVDFAYECNNPTTCTAANLMSVNGGTATTIQRNDNGAALSYLPVDMTFDVDGNAPFTFIYSDAGQVKLHVSKTVNTATLLGSTNAFVVRPFGFRITDPPSGVTGASSTPFTSAGTPFNTTLTAVVWESADDADNDGVPDSQGVLSANAATPNFGRETVAATATLSHALTEPVSSPNPGSLTGSTNFSGFSNGTKTQSVAFSEVGIIRLLATTSNYLGGSQDVTAGLSTAGLTGVGRFIPHHFDATLLAHGCPDSDVTPPDNSFTYSGQPFSVTVTAKNLAGGPTDTTKNYDGTLGFSKAVTISNAGTTTNFANHNITAANFTNGFKNQITITYTYPVASKETVTASLTLRAIEDAGGDSVSSAGYTEDAAAIRSGRLRIINAYGSELAAQSLPLRVEYFSTDGWITNDVDTCTALDGTILDLTNAVHLPPPGLGAATIKIKDPPLSTTTVTVVTPTAGVGELSFTAPLVDGYADARMDLPAQTWLRFDWDGDNTEEDPTGRATFGLFRGSPKHIYQRERY
ncbi:MAG: hypothetical protein Q7J84_12915 [Sulfuricaulis sp.]|nr:hypothetical protein [Sulfuricaulis sp.]